MIAADIHTWPDVIYLVLLAAVAVLNTLHNKRVGRKANEAQDIANAIATAVDDVKRATGLVKRAEDPAPPAPPTAIIDAPGQRRATDHTDPPVT